eukprot:TRINITY_DN60845_c0_g1_i1.p3 TRINITY_DN60845_c0_g1~~TRINITY_DN60845_c0_g1_i1.p3  ORF type:complete len:106 (+),score=27.65 TRINITY_DN60845_c0_g1_i1:69-386(+)
MVFFFFFSSRRRHTRCREVSWARRCVQETVVTHSLYFICQINQRNSKHIPGADYSTGPAVIMTIQQNVRRRHKVIRHFFAIKKVKYPWQATRFRDYVIQHLTPSL